MDSLLYTILFALLVLGCHCQERIEGDGKKVYIVYMGERPQEGVFAASLHHSMLEDVLGSNAAAKDSLVHSYGRSFNGFAAKLSEEEAERFSEMEGVASVLPNTIMKLHTTRSWDFMGFTQLSTPRYPHESDVIIGMLDSGFWPESESFNDEGFGPPPPTWKGVCQTTNVTCNNKVIGARFYNSYNTTIDNEIQSPRDTVGHGTHTASTVAGRAVQNASYLGLGEGTARGAVPQARLAIYKVCWSGFCTSADILAGFDDAIADGVDIISVSLGGSGRRQYFDDAIAIGSFHAMKNGILTSNSAGNSGPFPRTVSNHAPWSLTVAASSIDRKFVSQVVLGNGQTFLGNSINSFTLNGTVVPLVYGGDIANVSSGLNGDDSRVCFPDSLNSDKAKGKIVLCDLLTDGSGVMLANGLGTIMSDFRAALRFPDVSFSFPISASLITIEDAEQVLDYIRSTSNPIATILRTEALDDVIAPRVVAFSSRGPSPISPDILKPDLTAPGVDIVASWSPLSPPSGSEFDTRSVNFNIISGTSMSCPHASGAAAYVKSAHPTWSPAAIKSALMTTASRMDNKNEDAEFAYGSGHINPLHAVNPGLVFDASERDYVNYLCTQGYNTTTLRLITGDSSACVNNGNGKAWDLNYPSMSLSIPDGKPIWGYFPRTVTNVGPPNCTYHAIIYGPSSLKVTIKPSVLRFTSTGESLSFAVTIEGGVISQQPIISGAVVWTDGAHVVRSPFVVYTVLPSNQMFYNKFDQFEGSSMYNKDRFPVGF